ncbi:MAG: hypothetical protein J6T77_00565 [Clostridia bacterium]|nr:hypothetical protein [Clostridia bacterium]
MAECSRNFTKKDQSRENESHTWRYLFSARVVSFSEKRLRTERFAAISIADPKGDPATCFRGRITPEFDFVQEHSAFSLESTADRQALPGSLFTYYRMSFNKEKQLLWIKNY